MFQMRQKDYFDSDEFREAYHFDGVLGSVCSPQGTVFRLWAPTAQRVDLALYQTGSGEETPELHRLVKTDRGVWEFRTERNLDGFYYCYAVTVGGMTQTTADPYAKGCGVNGMRSMVIDLSRTNPEGWEEDRAPAIPPENIIYEVHVKDFSWDPASGILPEFRGKYLGLCQSGTTLYGDGVHPTGLDYLKTLGVTHMELMPVYDYGSVDEAGDDLQYNWGYDPVNYNVPEGSYSSDPFHGEVRIRELKQAIQTLHQNGFRVIMDMVYNHTYRLDSCLQRTVPWYYYRQKENGAPSNGSGCGNETAGERSMCGKYILDSVLYWAEEYHIDGFRFDLMGILPVELMHEIRKALDERFGVGEKLMFGEPWCADETAERPGTTLCGKENLRMLPESIGAFCDSTRDAVKGSLMSEDARGIVNGGEFSPWMLEHCMKGWAGESEENPVKCPGQTICYLSCHDDWTLWDRLVNTITKKPWDFGRNEKVLRANRLAAAILFGCQGNLFLLSGEEFGRTKNGIKNSYASSPEINKLDWERAWQNHDLAEYYRGLFALRKLLPSLRDKTAEAGGRLQKIVEWNSGCLMALLDNSGETDGWNQLLIAYNAGKKACEIALPEGKWQLLADGENSFCWKEEQFLWDQLELPPVSAAVLGLSQMTR